MIADDGEGLSGAMASSILRLVLDCGAADDGLLPIA